MFLIDQLILFAAVLGLIAIGFGKFAARLGMPLLVLFVGVGMLAGSEGIGGVAFEDYELAHAFGTLALAVILFDGGLRTSTEAFRIAWRPAAALATGGVLLTTAAVGAFATFALGLPLLEGLLLGAIAGSTDAAAVFAVLRGQRLNLDERLTRTLEIESGSNDPMAIFLTVGLLEVLLGRMELGPDLLVLLILQMGVGALGGLVVGRLGALLINRINLDSAGLYPVMTSMTGLLGFGLAASLGGSGFLAVYVTGIVIGNRPLVFRRGTLLFHDGIAWLAQIFMFIVLGLLSFPSRVVDAAPEGLMIAAVLVFAARPAAVFAMLAPFGFTWREMLFIAWAGLKGAVPIILAIFPLLLGLGDATLLFDVVFFVVLVSAILQGSTLGWLARRLRLLGPDRPEPPVSLEITSLKELDGDIIGYHVGPESPAAGHLVRDLGLPHGALVALIARHHEVIPPRGATRIHDGDHVFVIAHNRLRPVLNRLLGTAAATATLPPDGFELAGHLTLANLERLYGVRVDADPALTLAAFVRAQLGDAGVAEGVTVTTATAHLQIRDMEGDAIKRVNVKPAPPPDA